MHKRHFFSDEREVRAVMWSITPLRKRVDPFLNADRTGFLTPIDPKVLVRSVVLHPEASAGTAGRVLELCNTHGLPEPLSSRIASNPQF